MLVCRNGLNVSVSVATGFVSTTRVWPLAEPDVVDDPLLVPLLLHALAARARAAATATAVSALGVLDFRNIAYTPLCPVGRGRPALGKTATGSVLRRAVRPAGRPRGVAGRFAGGRAPGWAYDGAAASGRDGTPGRGGERVPQDGAGTGVMTGPSCLPGRSGPARSVPGSVLSRWCRGRRRVRRLPPHRGWCRPPLRLRTRWKRSGARPRPRSRAASRRWSGRRRPGRRAGSPPRSAASRRGSAGGSGSRTAG